MHVLASRIARALVFRLQEVWDIVCIATDARGNTPGMLCHRLSLATVLLATAWLVTGEASAQAHGPPATELIHKVDWEDPSLRAAKLAEMDEWLRRLVGTFYNLNNTVDHDGQRVNCRGLGTGPGVQCLSGMKSSKGMGRILRVMLFGLDPGVLRINYMQVNAIGLPEGGMGRHSGNTLYLKFKCIVPQNNANKNILSCDNKVQFYTLPNSKELQISSEIILRIMTSRGVVESSSVSYNWLKRLPESGSRKRGAIE